MSRSGKTPGQAAYEARHVARAARYGLEPGPLASKWSALTTDEQANWEASAQAVLDQAFPGLRRQLDEARAENTRLQALVRQALDDAGVPEDVQAEWLERAGIEAGQ